MAAIPYHLIGFSSEEEANAAVGVIDRTIFEMAQQLALDLRGLDGVTVAHDYPAALAALDRGFPSRKVLASTDDDLAQGIAMAPLIFRDGQIKSHLVLNASVIPTIDQPLPTMNGRYIIGHELAHVHEHYWRDQILPNTMLKPLTGTRDCSILFQMIEASWCEYVACCISAPAYPEQVKAYERVLVNLLGLFRERVIRAKMQWLQDRDFGLILQKLQDEAESVLKYAAYLLGHAAGLQKTPEEIAPEAWAALGAHPWLLTSIERFDDTLRATLASFETWTGMEAFDPLREIARGLLVDFGLTMTLQEDRSLYLVVSEGKVWTTT